MLKLRESCVSRIRVCDSGNAPPNGIEFPNETRVAFPCVRRCDFFETVVPPKPAFAAKRRDAALGADSRAGKNENAIRGGDVDHRLEVYRA